MSSIVKSFYKYCPINDSTKLEDEYSLINLLNNEATFSTRSNFNDLFDTKILLVKPSNKELKTLTPLLKGTEKKDFKAIYLGEKGSENIDRLVKIINKKFDKYLYYCVTDDEKNNLMWSHYANSHKGFCIEWDANKINAQKMKYRKTVASFNLIDIIKLDFKIVDEEKLEKKVLDAFRIKLEEWKYESEYRIHLGNKMQHLIKTDYGKFALVKYDPKWVKSIIFGCRMDEGSKEYIRNNLPYKVQFKQAKAGDSSILIKSIQ